MLLSRLSWGLVVMLKWSCSSERCFTVMNLFLWWHLFQHLPFLWRLSTLVFTTLTGTLTKSHTHMRGLYFIAFNARLFDTLYCKHCQCLISFWAGSSSVLTAFQLPQHFFSERCRIKSMSVFSPHGFRHCGFKAKVDDSRLEVLVKHWALIAANGKQSLYGCELSFSEAGICWCVPIC